MQPVPLEHTHLPIRGRRSSEAISMQSVPLEHAHLPIALGSPLEPAQLDVPDEGGHQHAISMQSACNHSP